MDAVRGVRASKAREGALVARSLTVRTYVRAYLVVSEGKVLRVWSRMWIAAGWDYPDGHLAWAELGLGLGLSCALETEVQSIIRSRRRPTGLRSSVR